MIDRRMLIGGAAPLILAGCGAGNTVTFRYKLTLEVEVDGQRKVGANVIEMTYGQSWYEGYIGASVTGEALAIELRPGELLVALLGRANDRTVWRRKTGHWGQDGPGIWQIPQLYGVPRGPKEHWVPWLRRAVAFRGKRELPEDWLPDLVTFDHPAEPTTIREVDPHDLAASFGPGVRLHRALIEITNEPITQGRIEKVLPWPTITWTKGWLGRASRTHSRSGNALADSLSAWEFKRSGR